MKVALVHDWLNTKRGGAELVLEHLAALYPDAPIYTLVHDADHYGTSLPRERIRTSALQKLPAALKRRPRYLLPLIPMAVEAWDFSDFDVVISSSSAWVKGIITKPETLHICYCHTPMRMVWDAWPGYVEDQGVDPIRRGAIHRLVSQTRLWDFYSAARVDRWVANSQTTADRIAKFYRKDADAIIYPGADLSLFGSVGDEARDYFVTLCSLTPYKRVDLAIEVCNTLGKRLIVIGDGSDRERLEKLAGPTVTFAGRVDDHEKARLLRGARAMIFAGHEDFGIAPVEAMAAGAPVIAYGRGGLTETVIEGKTGIFFKEQTAQSLEEALGRFDSQRFDASAIANHAANFSIATFVQDFGAFVEKEYQAHVA